MITVILVSWDIIEKMISAPYALKMKDVGTVILLLTAQSVNWDTS